MKNVMLRLLGIIAFPFLLALVFAHYIALAFAASLVAAMIAGFGFGQSVALVYFGIAWKVYGVMALFTLAFLLTFSYQHCCVGLQRFGDHLKHHGWKIVTDDILGAIIWPWAWYWIDRNLKGWGLTLGDALCNAIEYWLVSSWRGIRFTHIDMRSGEVTTKHVKSPEESRDAIVNVLKKDLPKRT